MKSASEVLLPYLSTLVETTESEDRLSWLPNSYNSYFGRLIVNLCVSRNKENDL